MRFYKFAPAVCILTFFIGYGIAPSQKVVTIQTAVAPAAPAPVPEITNETAISEPEIFADVPDRENWSEEKFKIKLLETGEGYHGDQVNARTGEVWLGLFGKDDEGYSLRSTKVRVPRVFDQIVDDEITNKWTGKSVFTDTSAKSVFLLKGAKLAEGPITTLYRAPPDDEDPQIEDEDLNSIRTGFRRDFTIGKTTYTLTARPVKTKTGEAILALVLESEGISQVIHTAPDFEDNYLGSLEWAGDLDRDGKPDFYFSLYVHDNVEYRNLFLSSPAKKGKLVEKVAFFWTTGC
jgi:hypothetical protein